MQRAVLLISQGFWKNEFTREKNKESVSTALFDPTREGMVKAY